MSVLSSDLVLLGLGLHKDTRFEPRAHRPTLTRGIHLRWSFNPDLGFPSGGFHLYRRPSGGASADLLDGWAPLPFAPGPITLPVFHPAYRGSGGKPEFLEASRRLAKRGVRYGSTRRFNRLSTTKPGGRLRVEPGSTEVQGVRTSWGPELAGQHLHITGLPSAWGIESVDGPDRLTLSRPYSGPALAAPRTYRVTDDPFAHLHDLLTRLILASFEERTELIGQLLDMALDPANAQALGLGWVDRVAESGQTYDYLLVADYRFGVRRGRDPLASSDAMLEELRKGPARAPGITAAVAEGCTITKQPPVTAPGVGSIETVDGGVRVGGSVPEWTGWLPGAGEAATYRAHRADSADASAKAYVSLDEGAVDPDVSESTGYRLAAVDIFGRYSPLGPPFGPGASEDGGGSDDSGAATSAPARARTPEEQAAERERVMAVAMEAMMASLAAKEKVSEPEPVESEAQESADQAEDALRGQGEIDESEREKVLEAAMQAMMASMGQPAPKKEELQKAKQTVEEKTVAEKAADPNAPKPKIVLPDNLPTKITGIPRPPSPFRKSSKTTHVMRGTGQTDLDEKERVMEAAMKSIMESLKSGKN